MSTRVQKGSTTFKPVAKPKIRPVAGGSRQSSLTADNRSSLTPGPNRDSSDPAQLPSSSMPPPPFIPGKSGIARGLEPLDIPAASTNTLPPVITSSSNARVPLITSSISATFSTIQHNTTPPSTQDTPAERVKKRARRNIAQDSESGGEGTEPKKRARRANIGSHKARKSRAPSVPPFDPNADPGEELDPTAITMAALCADTGQGLVSTKAAQIQSNHAAWKASNKQRRARMKIRMEAKKYGRSTEEDGVTNHNPELNTTAETNQNSTPVPAPSVSTVLHAVTSAPSEGLDGGSNVQDQTGNGFDYSQALSTSRFNVQVRIGPNGETIIDEESLFVDRNDDDDDTQNYTHVEESDTTKFVNSATYGKKFRGTRWSAEETELFYDALSQFGENYELISYVLPGRDRKACKNKFKAEDKKDPNRITYCLTHRIPYDMQTLSRMTGKDFSGPTPEIRAPAPLTFADKATAEGPGAEDAVGVNKENSTPGPTNGEEVLGDITGFEDDA